MKLKTVETMRESVDIPVQLKKQKTSEAPPPKIKLMANAGWEEFDNGANPER